jgi:hypothetical protein
VFQLLVTANVVPSSLILVILMMEAINSSETLVLTRVTRRHIPEDDILHSHSSEKLKSYERDFPPTYQGGTFSCLLGICTVWL